MKKSFLKRAMAAAIAVPVALTQTVFAVAFAEDAQASTTLTVDTFMNVPTDGDYAKLVSDDGTTRVWEQTSLWNVTMYNAVNSLAGKTIALDVNALAESVKGDSDYAKLVRELILSGSAEAEISADAVVVTIKGDYAGSENGKIPATAGTVKITAKTGDLAASTEVPFQVELIDTELPEKALKAIEKAKEVEKSVAYSGTCDEILAQFKEEFADNKYVDKVPGTVAEVLDKAVVAKVLAKAITLVADTTDGKINVDVTTDDLAAVADDIIEIAVDASVAGGAGTATASGTLADEANVEELRAYFEEKEAANDYEIVEFSVVKVIDASAKGDINTFSGSGKLDIKRVITYTVKEEEPTETDPTETDPTETDPTETDPTETDPTETDPTETDPTETDPTETDPTETDPTETDPTETDPTETDPTQPPTDEPGLDVVVVSDGVNYFFSHDETPLAAEELVESAKLVVDENEYDVMSQISFGLDENGPIEGLTPAMIFEETGTAYVATSLYVYYTPVGHEPELVEEADVAIFVGVKGDADLDSEANAIDAAKVLVYAAARGAGEDVSLYSDENAGLETLAYFLADVFGESRDCGEDGSDLNALDAAGILQFAAEKGANPGKSDATIWGEVMGSTEE
ncbi:MAG: hypothetical protein IKK51_08570 [Oscillospiraceae bacterium]|nr:hypothetical protein [Oscillospiraceae bacterium]